MTDFDRDHVDAEQLAAWADGGLPAAEAVLVEAHLADCPRCQAMAAAFASTEDVVRHASSPVRVPLSWWRRGSARWVLPLGAAAAASVSLWIAVSKNPEPPLPVQRVAQVESTSAPAVPPAPAKPIGAPPRATPAASTAVDQGATAPQEALPARFAAPAPPPPTPPPPPAPAEPPPAAPAVVPVQTSSSALSRSAASDAAVVQPTVVSEFTSQSPPIQTRVARTGQAAQGRAGAAPPPPSAPAAAPFRWRILSDGRVERANMYGTTWEPVAVDSTVGITAGVAPSRLVCWVVGRLGVVLVSTNGGNSFSRVDAREAGDLVAVRAIDGLRATVTTAGGRTFSTVDGGASWQMGTF